MSWMVRWHDARCAWLDPLAATAVGLMVARMGSEVAMESLAAIGEASQDIAAKATGAIPPSHDPPHRAETLGFAFAFLLTAIYAT